VRVQRSRSRRSRSRICRKSAPPTKKKHNKKHNFFTACRSTLSQKVKKDKIEHATFSFVRLTKTQKQSATLLLVLLTRTELTPISIWYALLALFYRDIFYLASYLASWRVVVHVVCTRVPPQEFFFFSRERARILFLCCRVSSSSFARSTRRERTNAPIIANGEVFFLRTERFCFRRITSLVSFCISHYV